MLLEQHSSVELLRQLLREAPPEALRKESAERDANGQTLLHAAVERATRSGGEGEKAEHAVALAELLAPEALLLTNRLRLTPIGLAVVKDPTDRLVDDLERAVLGRLQARAAPAASPSRLVPLRHPTLTPLRTPAYPRTPPTRRWCSSSCTRLTTRASSAPRS